MGGWSGELWQAARCWDSQAQRQPANPTYRVSKHAGFRNIVTHSPLVISQHADGSLRIQGIMNVTPQSSETIVQLVPIDELKGRVNESAVFARQLLEMKTDFPMAREGQSCSHTQR